MQRMRYDLAAFHFNALGKVFASRDIPRFFHLNKTENFPLRFLFNYSEVK